MSNYNPCGCRVYSHVSLDCYHDILIIYKHYVFMSSSYYMTPVMKLYPLD